MIGLPVSIQREHFKQSVVRRRRRRTVITTMQINSHGYLYISCIYGSALADPRLAKELR